jgi:hypothetical protein
MADNAERRSLGTFPGSSPEVEDMFNPLFTHQVAAGWNQLGDKKDLEAIVQLRSSTILPSSSVGEGKHTLYVYGMRC